MPLQERQQERELAVPWQDLWLAPQQLQQLLDVRAQLGLPGKQAPRHQPAAGGAARGVGESRGVSHVCGQAALLLRPPAPLAQAPQGQRLLNLLVGQATEVGHLLALGAAADGGGTSGTGGCGRSAGGSAILPR